MIDSLAFNCLGIYLSLGLVQFYLSLVGAPVLLFFFVHRFVQLRDPKFELRVTTPTHTILHFAGAIVFGLLLPMLYLINAQSSGLSSLMLLNEFDYALPSPWPAINRLDILLTLISIAWLSAHLLEGLLRWDRPIFGAHWLNRFCSGAALLFFLWLLIRAVWALWTKGADEYLIYSRGSRFNSLESLFIGATSLFLGPMSLLGAAIVHGFAFAESLNKNPAHAQQTKRRWPLALSVQAVLLILLTSPFWLSIPRVTHRQALGLLETHQESIIEIAQKAELDPALLAGIIYVAQTRDHPRITGELYEKFCVALWEHTTRLKLAKRLSPSVSKWLNASVGLCQVRPGTAQQVYNLLQNRDYNAANHDRLTQNPRGIFYYAFMDIKRESPERLLLEPSYNLRAAATVLSLLDDDWRQAGFPLNEQPEILATLYSLGFGKSHPKANPAPNDFGKRVASFMATKDCRRLFEVDTAELKEDNSS